MIVFLLVARHSNRKPQAWWILAALLGVIILRDMLTTLFSVPSSVSARACEFVIAMAGGWTVLWLLGDWLSKVPMLARFPLALATMLPVCVLVYCVSVGYGNPHALGRMAIAFGVFETALLLGLILSRRCCRGKHRPGRFMAWSLLWIPVATAVCFPVFIVMRGLRGSTEFAQFATYFVSSLPECMVTGAIVGAILYTLNLPFMLVAFRCPHYRDRFADALAVQQSLE